MAAKRDEDYNSSVGSVDYDNAKPSAHLSKPGISFVNNSDDSKIASKTRATMNSSGSSIDFVGFTSEPAAIRPGTVTSVKANEDSKISRKVRASMNASGGLTGLGDGPGKPSTASKILPTVQASFNTSDNSIDLISTISEPDPFQLGTVTSVPRSKDSKITRKLHASMNASGASIELGEIVSEPAAVRPGTVTSVAASSDSRIRSKLQANIGAGSNSSIAAARPGTVTSVLGDSKVSRKLSKAGPNSSGYSLDTVGTTSDPTAAAAVKPGFMTVSRIDSKVAAKIAAASGVGATAATDDSRVTRKASRASAGVVGAVQSKGDDPAQQKKESQAHFVQNELFMNEENEKEIDANDYLNHQIRAMKQDEEKKKMKKEDGKEQKDGAAAVPKTPGAFSIKGSKTGGWFTGGFMQRNRGVTRAHSAVIVDSGIKTVHGELIQEELTCWQAVDKTALYVGGCLLLVVILAVSIPLALVNAAPPAPSPAPTSPRMQFYDSFRNVIMNITGEQALVDSDSAQFKALNWIVYDDILTLDVQDENLIQRFALMTMYFENIGKLWFYREKGVKWGSGVSECDWDYVTCEETTVNNLELKKVGLVGTLVSELAQLTQLYELDISENALGEQVFPTVLTRMTSLTRLDVQTTGMGGLLPSAIGDLTNLQRLNFADNAFIGSIPETMNNLTNLEEIFFASNEFKGPIFSFALNWPKLTSLDAGRNQFTGTMPSEISRLSLLNTFVIYFNPVSGSLPSELGMLTNMVYFLWGTSNTIPAGSLPSEMGNMSKLTKLDLNFASLTGTFPTSFGRLLNLSWLNLDKNFLQGSLPTEIGLLTKLEFVTFSSNPDLVGTIPTQLGSLTALSDFQMQGTGLTGTMPTEICDLKSRSLEILISECNGNLIECECCTRCG